MKNISIKIDDNIFLEAEKIVIKLKKDRNRCINEAIDFYNKLHNHKLLSRQLSKESKLVSEESLKVLAEFEKISLT
jgi:hypothetical protein